MGPRLPQLTNLLSQLGLPQKVVNNIAFTVGVMGLSDVGQAAVDRFVSNPDDIVKLENDADEVLSRVLDDALGGRPDDLNELTDDEWERLS